MPFAVRLAPVALCAGVALAQQPPPTPSRQEALEQAMRDLGAAPPTTSSSANALGTQTGAMRLIDVSLDIEAAGGVSTEPNATLRDLQGGGHDPKRRGFTLQQAELSLVGAVDPWLQAKAHMVTFLDPDSGETQFELEEAYLQTSQLPWDLQVKAGTYLTEFGRINAQHPHQWDWLDQPVIHTRLFGGDGMRGPGARVSWLVPGATYGELFFGVQNANGETMTSFLADDAVYAERAIGGRQFAARDVRSGNDLVYSLRGVTSLDTSEASTLMLGASAVYGPNPTGGDASTSIVGADFLWRWRPAASRRGYPFVKLQGEYLSRAFDAAAQIDASNSSLPVTIPGDTLRDQGAYLQLLYGFAEGWAAGVRVDWATGSGGNYDGGTQAIVDRSQDPYRADRTRVAPMLCYAPSEFSRVRLQYDYDDSDSLAHPAHSLWLGFEVLIGTHPPHSY